MTLQPPHDEPFLKADATPPPKTIPPAVSTLRRFFLDHNPCFLLSAVFMFLGCYLINSALDVRTGDVQKLFSLLGAINAYEVALLCIGTLLLRRTHWNRDGVLLLIIQMLFLSDGPFLLAETAMASAHWASTFNAGLLILAVIKATIAMRALKISLRPRTLGFLLLQLILIYSALPIFFSHVAVDGIIGAAPMYLAWWIVGMLPALYELLAKLDPLPTECTSHAAVRRAYVIVPWLILIAHLGFFQWAYRATFFAGDLSPILIGIAIATLRIGSASWLKRSDLQLLRVLLPAVALILGGVSSDTDLQWTAGSNFFFSPGVITLAIVFLTYAYFLSVRLAMYAAALVGLLEMLRLLGVTLARIQNTATGVADQTYQFSIAFLPSTPIAWGILAIIAAFALLAVGGFLTFRRPSAKPTSK